MGKALSIFVAVLALASTVAISSAAWATTTSLNPAADSQLTEASPTTNYGTATTVTADGDTALGNDAYPVLRFDLSSIPPGSAVTAAELDAQVTNNSWQPYEIYALKRSWTEGGVTWNSPWATPGAKAATDRESVVLGYVDSHNVLGWSINALNASGVAKVQSWVDSPSTNYGLVVANTDNTDGLQVYSKEGATKPVLKVTYSAAASVPAAPSGLSATAASSSGINLSWADNATNEGNYAVERSADGTNFSTVTSSLAANTTSYSDAGLSPSSTYYYRVKATNASGSSGYSNTANATTSAAASLYFSDDFERDADTMQPPWESGTCYGGAGGGITTDPFPRKGSYSAKVTTYDGDCPSFPTRDALRWAQHFCEGNERWIGYSMYLPAGFPADNPGWMNLGQFGYGPPWGYPPFHFSYWGNGASQGMTVYDQNTVSRGSIPVTLGAWNDIVMHVHFSSNPAVGSLQIFKNGVSVLGPLSMNTLRTDATGCGSLDLQQYRQAGVWPNPLSVFFDEAKVGDSYADVAP